MASPSITQSNNKLLSTTKRTMGLVEPGKLRAPRLYTSRIAKSRHLLMMQELKKKVNKLFF